MTLMAIPEGAIPLAVGTLLALVGLSLVLSPLLTDGSDVSTRAKPAVRRAPAPEATDGAVAALREIEFDRETGKLSDRDYSELKARYTKAAIEEMRAADRLAHSLSPSVTAALMNSSPIDSDPVEAAIRRAQAKQLSCVNCGPRIEPDATYCSNCGKYLPSECPHCHAPVTESSAAFCSRCGDVLNAFV